MEVFTLLVLAFFQVITHAAPLPALNCDPSQSSVSGLSSGAYMAVQLHVAFSSTFRTGCGVFAGGPYDCAEGSTATALTTCMNAIPFAPNPATYVQTTVSRAQYHLIDDFSNMTASRVYMFSGTQDTTVHQPVMDALHTYYRKFVSDANILYENSWTAAHTFPTDESINTNPCTVSTSPYISNCNYDGAGIMFAHIYNSSALHPRNDGALSGQFLQFSQSPYISTSPASASMSDFGFAYIPQACQSQVCRVHVALHGCEQTYDDIQDKFVHNTGYNKWADTNNIVVLYPQAVKSQISNPNGCWDWFGYTNGDYDVQKGIQMAAIKAMVDQLTSGFAPVAPPAQVSVTSVTNNSIALTWQAAAKAVAYQVLRDGQVVADSVQGLQYNDTGLQPGTRYIHSVVSIASSGGHSQPSMDVVATTSGSPPPIAPPSGLTVSNVTAKSVALTWKPEDNVDGYVVYRNGTRLNHGIVGSVEYTDSTVASSSTYSYTVTSARGSTESPPSAPVTATTPAGYTCQQYTDSNFNHVAQGRAYVLDGFALAKGSNQNMGLWNIFQYTTLAETSLGYYVIGYCHHN
eukprot:TRINITY_DN862_c0_g1_i4.p1 TRINITY_DN862_c0_g1~~TRINITY_DN862_c0_g1_i4.p1  ORF type:complete len:574 (-),score=114.66 TRINITY_DN862_c0_g1_i4:58-1779(-)